jgi:hypothetical protein
MASIVCSGWLSVSRTAEKGCETAIRYAAVELALKAALECCKLRVVVAAESLRIEGVCGPMISGQEIDVQADMRAGRPQCSSARSSQHAFARIPCYLDCHGASRSSAPISGAILQFKWLELCHMLLARLFQQLSRRVSGWRARRPKRQYTIIYHIRRGKTAIVRLEEKCHLPVENCYGSVVWYLSGTLLGWGDRCGWTAGKSVAMSAKHHGTSRLIPRGGLTKS